MRLILPSCMSKIQNKADNFRGMLFVRIRVLMHVKICWRGSDFCKCECICVTQEIHSTPHECFLSLVMWCHLTEFQSSGSHLRSATARQRWLCQVSLCQWAVEPKESQAWKPGDKFSSQLKLLTGLQFSCLYLNSPCVCKTLGMWNTHTGLTNMT